MSSQRGCGGARRCPRLRGSRPLSAAGRSRAREVHHELRAHAIALSLTSIRRRASRQALALRGYASPLDFSSDRSTCVRCRRPGRNRPDSDAVVLHADATSPAIWARELVRPTTSVLRLVLRSSRTGRARRRRSRQLERSAEASRRNVAGVHLGCLFGALRSTAANSTSLRRTRSWPRLRGSRREVGLSRTIWAIWLHHAPPSRPSPFSAGEPHDSMPCARRSDCSARGERRRIVLRGPASRCSPRRVQAPMSRLIPPPVMTPRSSRSGTARRERYTAIGPRTRHSVPLGDVPPAEFHLPQRLSIGSNLWARPRPREVARESVHEERLVRTCCRPAPELHTPYPSTPRSRGLARGLALRGFATPRRSSSGAQRRRCISRCKGGCAARLLNDTTPINSPSVAIGGCGPSATRPAAARGTGRNRGRIGAATTQRRRCRTSAALPPGLGRTS